MMSDEENTKILEHISFVITGLNVFRDREDLLTDLFNHVEAEMLENPVPVTEYRIVRSVIGFMETHCANAVSEAQLEEMAEQARTTL
tara:strand:+ start:205 stop:465 length:261 start_codon:yes stop_codon:yes gene_type:complete